MLKMEQGFWHAAVGLLALFGVAGAWAQSYPIKPVRLLVGFATGGGTDVTAHFFA